MDSELMNISELTSQSRSSNILHHIKFSFVYKFLGVLFNFLLIPVTVNYAGGEKYGIWMTLLSILSWVTFFDIGLGNSMRNKIAEALALNKTSFVKSYISTSYAIISIIAVVIFILVIAIVPFVNMNFFFNTHTIENSELRLLFIITSLFLLSNFIFALINQILNAYQRASVSAFNQALSSGIALLFTYALTLFSSNNIIYLAIAYGSSLLLSNFIIGYFFFQKHNEAIPSIRNVDFKLSSQMGSLGLQFFIIQIAALVIFTTDNIIITQIFGPEYVTTYNIVYKYFSIVSVAHYTLVTPLISAYTEAFAKNDIQWIRNIIKKLNLLMVPIIAAIGLLCLLSNYLIPIWIGKPVEINNYLLIFMAIYTIISIWNNIYAIFVNGIGKIRLQLYSAILAAVINVPLCFLFAKTFGLGTSGIILATIFSLSLFAVIGPIQTYSILKSKK